MSQTRMTALVTGASAGIGKAFADVFAKYGFNLILTARREDRLRAVARELEAKHRIKADVIVADLSDPAVLGQSGAQPMARPWACQRAPAPALDRTTRRLAAA